MASTRITTRLPPNIDPTKAPLAYGDRALPKLNCELNDNELITRQRALMTLCDYLHDPEHIRVALRVGIVQSLKRLLTDSDTTVRHKTTEAFHIIVCHSIGRDAFLQHEVITPISVLFDDPRPEVRRNTHQAIEMLSEVPFGADGVVQAKLVPKLVGKLVDEEDEIKELILDSLHFCLRVDTEDALIWEAINIFSELLSHKSPLIRSKAARDIMDLSVPLEGKDQAREVNCMSRLVELLRDDSADVRANAAGAIMHIAITTKGKYQALEAGAIENLVQLINDDNSEVRLNVIKAITVLSEAPQGRNALLQNVPQIQVHIDDESLAVRVASKIAVNVITWRP